MEPADHNMFEDFNAPAPEDAGPANVLLVLPDGALRADWSARLHDAGHAATSVSTVDAARRALGITEYDLILIQPEFDGGAGMRMARHVQRSQYRGKMMLVTEDPNPEIIIDAMRLGMIDVVTTPVDPDDFTYTVECALMKARDERSRDARILRLRDMCSKLSAAKKESTRQVDILCRDLATAYDDIAERMNTVAMASEFRTLLSQELDLESLLRTTLEYLLTKTGPTNAAVFLPDAERNYSLGAYVNYNCPRETADVLLEHLCDVVCPHMEDEPEIVMFDDADELAGWIGEEADFLRGSQVIAFRCADGEECLAMMVLFRDQSHPFADDLAGVLDTLRPIFAHQLASVINVHQRARPQWPQETPDDGWETDEDYGFGGLAA